MEIYMQLVVLRFEVVFTRCCSFQDQQGSCLLFYDLFRDSFGRRQRQIANQKQERVGLCWMQKQHTQTHNTGRPVCNVWGDTYDGAAASHWTRSNPWVSLGYRTFFWLFFCPSDLFACKWVFRLLTGYAIVSAGWCQMATSCCLPETNSRWANRVKYAMHYLAAASSHCSTLHVAAAVSSVNKTQLDWKQPISAHCNQNDAGKLWITFTVEG